MISAIFPALPLRLKPSIIKLLFSTENGSKKAQEYPKKYRDGAFSAWLINTYGNRQTPYNFLQYYEFYLQLSPTLHLKLDAMPRQAVYTLASRDAPFEQKEELLKNYNGETKNEVLTLIRKTFPLDDRDGRKEDLGEQAVTTLKKLEELFTQKRFHPTNDQKLEIQRLLSTLTESRQRLTYSRLFHSEKAFYFRRISFLLRSRKNHTLDLSA